MSLKYDEKCVCHVKKTCSLVCQKEKQNGAPNSLIYVRGEASS